MQGASCSPAAFTAEIASFRTLRSLARSVRSSTPGYPRDASGRNRAGGAIELSANGNVQIDASAI
jgi:hypothetical protein